MNIIFDQNSYQYAYRNRSSDVITLNGPKFLILKLKICKVKPLDCLKLLKFKKFLVESKKKKKAK